MPSDRPASGTDIITQSVHITRVGRLYQRLMFGQPFTRGQPTSCRARVLPANASRVVALAEARISS
jgi:hypothetical protein